MTSTLSAADIRNMFRQFERIEDLTALLRHKHFDVPCEKVYAAAGAVDRLREIMLRVCVQNVEVETVQQKEAA